VNNNLQNKIEICVSDNSTDGLTEPILKQYAIQGIFKLTYVKNEKNLGYDKNVIKALSLGSGRYLHLLSDEDRYDEHSLLELISILEKEKPDCILLTMHLKKHVTADLGIFKILKGNILPKLFSLKGKGMMFFGLLSCVLIRHDFYLDFIKQFEVNRFYGLGYLHVPIYLWALRKSKKIIVYGKDYRVRKAINKNEGKLVIAFPSEILDLVCKNYFQTITLSSEAGIIDDTSYMIFKKNYLNFVLYILFENRTFIYPDIFQRENIRIRATAAEFLQNYSLNNLQKMLVSAYIGLLYTSWIPYHLIYRVWVLYRVNIKKDVEVMDIHASIKNFLSGANEFDTLAERTYET